METLAWRSGGFIGLIIVRLHSATIISEAISASYAWNKEIQLESSIPADFGELQ
jgi:hypothetical protein